MMLPPPVATEDPGLRKETIKWGVKHRLEKRQDDAEMQAALASFIARHGDENARHDDEFDAAIAAFHARVAPDEVIEVEGNILVNAGIDALLNLLAGAGGTAFNNANAYIGVGDSATAAAVAQTDLQAASNKLRAAMNSTYPSLASHVLTFQASFTSGQANWVWNEWAIFNASSGGTMLNRKVESLGTKVTGTWTLSVTLTPS